MSWKVSAPAEHSIGVESVEETFAQRTPTTQSFIITLQGNPGSTVCLYGQCWRGMSLWECLWCQRILGLPQFTHGQSEALPTCVCACLSLEGYMMHVCRCMCICVHVERGCKLRCGPLGTSHIFFGSFTCLQLAKQAMLATQ